METEYVALSLSLREMIHIIALLEDLSVRGFPVHKTTPKFMCKTFRDNQSCIRIATNNCISPRNKHFTMRVHHFQLYIVNIKIMVKHVDTKSQIAHLLTKPLPKIQFRIPRSKIMKWQQKPSDFALQGSVRICYILCYFTFTFTGARPWRRCTTAGTAGTTGCTRMVVQVDR